MRRKILRLYKSTSSTTTALSGVETQYFASHCVSLRLDKSTPLTLRSLRISLRSLRLKFSKFTALR
ncbi:MAG: hypothetical protein LBF59_00515 [Prevotellaceae bacterium]|nr:hypothetical protein [Prevotellaceae bacterium]